MMKKHQSQNTNKSHLKSFNPDWKNWIKTNMDAGCDKNGIFKILLEEGFPYNLIKETMRFEPTIPLEEIINPLKQNQENKQKNENHYKGAITKRMENPFIPNGKRLKTKEAEFYLLEDFLNQEECTQIIALITKSLRPSDITKKDEPDKYFRTSSTCDLGLLDDKLVHELDRRICSVMGLDPDYSENIQGQHYEVGQEFKAHTDFFEKNEIEEFGGSLGQRSYTFMVYLNDVEEGGETSFPQLNQTISPKMGKAVIWNNLHPDGTSNHNSLHKAFPVKKGVKTVITKWFRTKDGKPVFSREDNEFIPNFTNIGFKKDSLPEPLFKKITNYYNQNFENRVEEKVPGEFILNKKENKPGSYLIDLSESLKNQIHDCLKSSLEEWCGVKLEPTFVYGIRIYEKGSSLKEHRDQLETHIISAIINVDQKVNVDWPLFIEDNYYRKHEVLLNPGDVIFYEGGRLLHGRPNPLNGERFANIFCHFKPVNKKSFLSKLSSLFQGG